MGGDEQSVCNGPTNRSSVANLFIADAAHGALGNFCQCYRSSSLSGEITNRQFLTTTIKTGGFLFPQLPAYLFTRS